MKANYHQLINLAPKQQPTNMNLEQATQYLQTAVETETGKHWLRAIYGSQANVIIKQPTKGDAPSTILVAERLQKELNKRYGF